MSAQLMIDVAGGRDDTADLASLDERKTLERVRALIDTPERWTGRPLAGRLTTLAAFTHVIGGYPLDSPAWRLLRDTAGHGYMADFEESCTHAEMMAAFDRSIKSTREREAA